jgi:hypothetical protein
MREVPMLSAESEARLTDLYHSIEGITNKGHILRILAFGGGSAAAAVLKAAVTTEFSGQKVSGDGCAILYYVPELCGVLARRNDDAFEFLMAGSKPGFWAGLPLWQEANNTEVRVGALQGGCIKGLALSGRSEGRQLLRWYRAHPEAAAILGAGGKVVDTVDGSVVDAAFMARTVDELGLEATMDEVFAADLHDMMKTFREWRGTPEGQAWGHWSAMASAAVRAKTASDAPGEGR